MNILLIQDCVQLDGAVEYTDCISAEGWDSLNECPDIWH